MPDAFRNWARRHTPALATLYLLLLLAVCIGSLAVLFEWRGTGRAVAKIGQLCNRLFERETEKWEARLREAERLFSHGDAAAAELALDALLADLPVKSRLGPDGRIRSRVLKRLVDVYLAQDSRRNALRACEALLLLNPDYAEETFLYGKTLLATGNREEGERQLLKSFELDPNYTPAVEFLIRHYAEGAHMREIVEIHDRYQNAFSSALGAMEPDNGVIEFVNKGVRVAARKYLPVLNPPAREVRLALGAPENSDPECAVDSLRLAFTLPPECGRFDVECIRLLPRRSLMGGDGEPSPLAELRDFSHAARAEMPIDDGTGSLAMERRFALTAPLPAPVRLGDVDAIEIRTSAAKQLSEEARAIVERARRYVELDRNRNRP